VTTFGDLLGSRPLVGILRGVALDEALRIADAFWTADAGLIEVPVQSDAAIEVLRRLVIEGRQRGQLVGAGTVVSPALVAKALDAGAAFTVAPGYDASVARASEAAGLPHLPGVGTASEVQAAVAAGFVWLKAFPASSLSTSWFRDMHGPFPDVQFVATGGVTADNAEAFHSSGARVLGVGSAIATPAQLQNLLQIVGAWAPS
jgi:2-dehydro-3-deoxyphosphogluconate aldolase / (4S)-4-hydroxy-2-oxoglutarate aldolase